MTQLRTLDLSFNEIESLESTEFTFSLPENLTRLHINRNRLKQFPINIFNNLSTVQFIDIQNNSIESFNPSLLRNVKNGLELHIAGKGFFDIFSNFHDLILTMTSLRKSIKM